MANEYLIQESSLTQMADAVRAMTGTTGKLKLDALEAKMTESSEDVGETTELITQIAEALEGKAAGGGTTLPTLTNEGSAYELFSGKQLINSTGKIVNGTFTIENELDTQEDLIAQIATAVNNLPEAGGGGGTSGGGICPQLTIKGTENENIRVGICFCSTNNTYTALNVGGVGVTELIINNVDINIPIVFEIKDNFGMFDGMDGINAEYISGNGYMMAAKCTAPGENSIIQLKELENWG